MSHSSGSKSWDESPVSHRGSVFPVKNVMSADGLRWKSKAGGGAIPTVSSGGAPLMKCLYCSAHITPADIIRFKLGSHTQVAHKKCEEVVRLERDRVAALREEARAGLSASDASIIVRINP